VARVRDVGRPRVALRSAPCFIDVPAGFDGSVNFGSCDVESEMALRAEQCLDPAKASVVFDEADYGGLLHLRGVLGPQLVAQMRAETDLLCGTLKPSSYWNGWQAGRGDSYGLVDLGRLQLGGHCALACGLMLLSAVCGRLSRFRPSPWERLRPTSQAQLALFAGGGAGYKAHTDSSSYEELGEEMPEDQRRIIAARCLTSILYLNEAPWDPSCGGALRAHRHVHDESGEYVDVSPDGGSLVLFRSRDLRHEVVPSARDRLALTMWFMSDSDL